MRARLYRLRPEQIVGQWEAQRRACAICRHPIDLEGRDSHIDHDHATGRARGLVCNACNRLVGCLERAAEQGNLPLRLALAAWLYVEKGGRWHGDAQEGLGL